MNEPLIDGMCFIEEQECSKACLQTNHCLSFTKPAAWHRRGGCPLSSIRIVEAKGGKKVFVNPLKASKRATQGK